MRGLEVWAISLVCRRRMFEEWKASMGAEMDEFIWMNIDNKKP